MMAGAIQKATQQLQEKEPQQMGINAHIRITRREQVEHLNFPFKR